MTRQHVIGSVCTSTKSVNMKGSFYLLLGVVAVSQAFFKDTPDGGGACLNCCGDGCCNDCNLDPNFLHHIQKTAVKGEKRRVLSTRSLIDDLNSGLHGLIPDFPDSGDNCYDCCGDHPCCNKCGLDELLSHHYPGIIGHTGTTAEPQSPEKDESYGPETGNPYGGIPGFPNIPPNLDPLDIKPAHSYFESNTE